MNADLEGVRGICKGQRQVCRAWEEGRVQSCSHTVRGTGGGGCGTAGEQGKVTIDVFDQGTRLLIRATLDGGSCRLTVVCMCTFCYDNGRFEKGKIRTSQTATATHQAKVYKAKSTGLGGGISTLALLCAFLAFLERWHGTELRTCLTKAGWTAGRTAESSCPTTTRSPRLRNRSARWAHFRCPRRC